MNRTHSRPTAHTNLSVVRLAVLASAVWLAAVEEASLHPVDTVFDDGFLNELDESFFETFPEETFLEEYLQEPPINHKRKRDADEDIHPLDSGSEAYSDEWPESGSERVSPSYDIERMSPGEPLPPKKRRRCEADAEADEISFPTWSTQSDESWEMLPAFENTQSSPENDSWQVSPQQNIDLPYAKSSQNPIGHILSNGIRTVHAEPSKPVYNCRACAKDLKGHQNNPTMHFMLPKHEKCWDKIAKDMHLSSSISKALYPPQWVGKSAKGNNYHCKQCGEEGSKRKIISHVMGAKCKQLRKAYADTLAWNGIED